MKPANIELANRSRQFQADASEPSRRPSGKEKPPAGWKQLTASWDTAIRLLVPDGYEDERGFHYGRPPMPRGGSSGE